MVVVVVLVVLVLLLLLLLLVLRDFWPEFVARFYFFASVNGAAIYLFINFCTTLCTACCCTTTEVQAPPLVG